MMENINNKIMINAMNLLTLSDIKILIGTRIKANIASIVKPAFLDAYYAQDCGQHEVVLITKNSTKNFAISKRIIIVSIAADNNNLFFKLNFDDFFVITRI